MPDNPRIYTKQEWDALQIGQTCEFLNAMHSGQRFECDEEMWEYWLEVLPPVWMSRTVVLDGQPVKTSFGFAEGWDTVCAFWVEKGRYFGQMTTIMNPCAFG